MLSAEEARRETAHLNVAAVALNMLSLFSSRQPFRKASVSEAQYSCSSLLPRPLLGSLLI